MTGVGRIVVALALAIGLWPGAVSAQITKAGVVTTLEGNVTAARSTAAQPVALKFKDDVFVNDRVVTGDRSLARLLLGGKAVVTVRERSALTITEVPGRSTINLDSGKVAVAVAKDRMQPGETIEVKSPNAVAAVRGTVFVVEVIRASASASNVQGVTVNHYVLTGQIALTVGSQVLNVGANNFASVTGNIVNSGIMSAAMRAGATSGLTSNMPKVAGAGAEAKETAFNTTIATFNAGTGLVTPPPPPPSLVQPITTPPLYPGGSGSDTLPPPVTPSPVMSPPVTPPPVTPPRGILLFGDADIFPMVASRAALASDLRAVHPGALITNLNRSTLPADLSAYGSIWQVGAFSPLSDSDRTRLAQFLARGGGLYLTGERQCCPDLNTAAQNLLRAVVAGGSGITVGSTQDFFFRTAAFNAGARDGVTTTPNVLTTWSPAAPGEMFGVTGANVLATIDSAVVAGVWGSGDLLGSAGRIVLMMDVDWLSNDDSLAICDVQCRRRIVENLAAFVADPAAPVTLATPLFRSVDETLSTLTSFFDMPVMTLTGTSPDPLLWFSGSTLRTAGGFARMTDSAIATAGSYLRLDSGAQVVQIGRDPFVSMSGGSLAVGTGADGGHIFDLVGRASFTEIDDSGTGLTVGSDRPIRPGVEAAVFDAANGATVNVRGNAYRIDLALLEATAPLLNLNNATSLTTGDHAINLVGQAKVSIPNDAVSMITLRASMMTVASGHLVNAGGGSVLNVAGNLVSLADASTLSILNGLLLNVSGGSSATIGRSLVSFTGSGNVLNITNSIVPTAIVGGIPVSGPIDSFRIGANAIGGAGSGTININGVPLTPTTPLSSLTGSLVAVQGSGAVNIGTVPAPGGAALPSSLQIK
jgi:hypothetical protein